MLSAYALDPDEGAVTQMKIDWGDGGAQTIVAPSNYDTEFGYYSEGSHDYPDQGTYHATIWLTDDQDETSDPIPFDVVLDNYAPQASIANSGPVNEGNSITVSLNNATDLGESDLLSGLRYSFATSQGGLAGSYAAAQGASSKTFTASNFPDSGSYTLWARVFDKDNGFSTYSTTAVLVNVAPFATLHVDEPAENGAVAVGLADAWDICSADAAAEFRYSFALDIHDLAASYAAASTSSSHTFTAAQMAGFSGDQIYAAIYDHDITGGATPRIYQINVPALAVGQPGTDHVNLSWTDQVTGETGWKIKYWIDGDSTAQYQSLPANSTEFALNELEDGSKYYFRVRAIDANETGHESVYSVAQAATTDLPAPTNVVASNINYSTDRSTMDVKVQWESTAKNFTSFIVQRFAANANVLTDEPIDTMPATKNDRSVVFSGITSSALNKFVVVLDKAGPPAAKSDPVEHFDEPTEPWTDVYGANTGLDRGPRDSGELLESSWGHVKATWDPAPYPQPNHYPGYLLNGFPEMTDITYPTVTLDLENLPRHKFLTVSVVLAFSANSDTVVDSVEAKGVSLPGEYTSSSAYGDLDYYTYEIWPADGVTEDALADEAKKLNITINVHDPDGQDDGDYWFVSGVGVQTYFPFVAISHDQCYSKEGGTQGHFRVIREGFGVSHVVDASELDVKVNTQSGSASSSDYSVPKMVHLSSNEGDKRLDYGIVDDDTPEWTEDFTVALAERDTEYVVKDQYLIPTRVEIVDNDLGLESTIPVIIDLNDDNIFSVQLRTPNDIKPGARVTLYASSYVNVWDNLQGSGTPYANGYTWISGVSEVPPVLYVEPIAEGPMEGDCFIGIGDTDAEAALPNTPANPTSNFNAASGTIYDFRSSSPGRPISPGPGNSPVAIPNAIYHINDQFGAGKMGHSAVIIPSDNGCTYFSYSMDGHVVVQQYNNIDDALIAAANAGYTRQEHWVVSQSGALAARRAALDFENTSYNGTTHNCWHMVYAALSAAGADCDEWDSIPNHAFSHNEVLADDSGPLE